MRIEFDPMNPDEAAALRAMLTAMHQPRADQQLREAIADTAERLQTATPSEPEFIEALVKNRSELYVNLDSPSAVDSNNEPHDPRIHSSPPTTNKDGTWRAKRGVKADEIAAVRAEREALTVETYVELPDDTPSEKVAEAFAEVVSAAPTYAPESEPPQAAQDAKVETVTAPPAPPSPTPPVETFAGGVAPSFLDVMKAITAAQKDGKIDTAKVKELCAAVGAGESTMGLNGPDNGDKRGQFMALLATETEGK